MRSNAMNDTFGKRQRKPFFFLQHPPPSPRPLLQRSFSSSPSAQSSLATLPLIRPLLVLPGWSTQQRSLAWTCPLRFARTSIEQSFPPRCILGTRASGPFDEPLPSAVPAARQSLLT